MLPAAIPALLILVSPGVAAVVYGRRARQEGRDDAIVPALIGGVAAAAAILVNLLVNLLAFVIGRRPFYRSGRARRCGCCQAGDGSAREGPGTDGADGMLL